MQNNSIPVDTGHVDGGNVVERTKHCYRCGNLSRVNEMWLSKHLCKSCYDDMRELGRAVLLSDSVKLRGNQVYKFTAVDGDRFWAIYHAERGDDIMEIARNFERNLIPVNVFEIQMQQKTGYLLTVISVTDRTVPLLMEKINPGTPTPNFRRILDAQTQDDIAMGRYLSDFILGKPCGNKLEITFREFSEMMNYALDQEKAGLDPAEILDKVLAQFHVSDPVTRKAALIGTTFCSSPDDLEDADAVRVPKSNESIAYV